MSGMVSYELLKSKLELADKGFTPEGGIYETFINNTGISKKGTIVMASRSIDNGVDIAPVGSQSAIGVIYESDIESGLPVKVVVYGKAEVLLKNGQSSNNGYWCGVSDVAGRMYELSSAPLILGDNRGIGFSIQSLEDGTDQLSLVQLNFG